MRLYFGSCWFCLTRRTLEWILDQLEMHPEYYRFFRNCNCSDESFFQTLVMNSPYAALREDYLHYIVWNKGKNNPEILTMKDYRDMIGSGMFLIAPIEPTTFFRNGMPCDYAALGALLPRGVFWHITVNNMSLINENFSKNACLKQHPEKWYSLKDIRSTARTILLSLAYPWDIFVGIKDYHIAVPHRKSDFTAVWERFPERMNETVHHRFRSSDDISHWLVRYWRIAEGNFFTKSQKYGIYTSIEDENSVSRITDIISRQNKKEICVNDTYHGNEFEKVRASITDAFNVILPEPSLFEK